jgi:hypothetical protein
MTKHVSRVKGGPPTPLASHVNVTNMTPHLAVASQTDKEYWRTFDLIRADVEAAIRSNHTFLTIHRLAAEDATIYEKYNRCAEFWTLNAFALQTTFFIIFGRVFDTRRDAHSVQKLIEATIVNEAIFSKIALRERKRIVSKITGPDPDWLVVSVNDAWEPTIVDLKALKTALTLHYDKFRAIYQPIRHQVYAHKSIQDDAAISALFSKTLTADVIEILRFLHTLLWAIWEMAWNGKRPDLDDFRDYDGYVRRVNTKTEEFIRQLQ